MSFTRSHLSTLFTRYYLQSTKRIGIALNQIIICVKTVRNRFSRKPQRGETYVRAEQKYVPRDLGASSSIIRV